MKKTEEKEKFIYKQCDQTRQRKEKRKNHKYIHTLQTTKKALCIVNKHKQKKRRRTKTDIEEQYAQ